MLMIFKLLFIGKLVPCHWDLRQLRFSQTVQHGTLPEQRFHYLLVDGVVISQVDLQSSLALVVFNVDVGYVLQNVVPHFNCVARWGRFENTPRSFLLRCRVMCELLLLCLSFLNSQCTLLRNTVFVQFFPVVRAARVMIGARAGRCVLARTAGLIL